MNPNEMLEELTSFCDEFDDNCMAKDDPVMECPFIAERECVKGDYTRETIEKQYLVLQAIKDDETGAEDAAGASVSDSVSHPAHYTNRGMECIDEMVLIFGVEVVKSFCKCNVWKYRYRANSKGGEEDMQKADWYMRKYRELSAPRNN